MSRPGLGLGEDVVVDVDHQVSARQVLHDEAHVVAGLEAAVEVDQEGVSGGVDRLKNPLLAHEAEEERGERQENRRRQVGRSRSPTCPPRRGSLCPFSSGP